MDSQQLDQLNKRSSEIMAQFSKINDLESKLEVQDEDAELKMIKSNIKKEVTQARAEFEAGNRKIKDKVGAIPDAAKVMTDKQYEDSMSFVLKH